MTIGTISPREAQTLVAQGAKLIDIRDADEYLYEHIPEAHLVPLSTLEQGFTRRAGDFSLPVRQTYTKRGDKTKRYCRACAGLVVGRWH